MTKLCHFCGASEYVGRLVPSDEGKFECADPKVCRNRLLSPGMVIEDLVDLLTNEEPLRIPDSLARGFEPPPSVIAAPCLGCGGVREHLNGVCQGCGTLWYRHYETWRTTDGCTAVFCHRHRLQYPDLRCGHNQPYQHRVPDEPGVCVIGSTRYSTTCSKEAEGGL